LEIQKTLCHLAESFLLCHETAKTHAALIYGVRQSVKKLRFFDAKGEDLRSPEILRDFRAAT